MKLKRHIDFINETSTGASLSSEFSFGNTHSILPQARRNFMYYDWDDFINTDFKVFQNLPPDEDHDEYGIYKILIGEQEYVFLPCIVYEKGVTNVHLVDLNTGKIYTTISEEIPESKDLKKGEFYINPNIEEYDSIIQQLIEQGFMAKKEESNQIVGERTSDIYKVLGV